MATLPPFPSLSINAVAHSLNMRRLCSFYQPASVVSAFDCLKWSLRSKDDELFSSTVSKWQSCPAVGSLTAICSTPTEIDIPTVAETKLAFLQKFRKPIPSIYNNVIQELLVQQHLMRYNRTYQYDAVFALGFVTVFDQLMDGYPNIHDKETIFRSYIESLKEDPDQYRNDGQKLEQWGSVQNAESIVSFHARDGEVESVLKDISVRAGGEGTFHYSRFFAIGLFRLLEKANATDPVVLEQFCKALNVSKLSVDRDLDTYRNLLSKVFQAKELLKEYIEREKKKQAERESSKASEAVAKIEVEV
eukprot:c26307_g1_i1 orf=548-1459(+)